ncbi:MAG: Rrf2 family transcriptional regulator [Rothia sp. (in: high G+C Gram-positive bacteria)]|uniref:RrF2 family transcriptional regulator n=1 Tax=Rothia sp. (in: high G+C Gram-positive bacteria) TaxID=1885016 RepID=UPI0026E0082E|nr:Rrf2 family transcriptional regulator [Rothia sp. (in: high G+C Gram-positive bacteria)]MDO5750928.1 Rrf2 family transcriptional regulator [Rothia sp. (in: high G+C Gram-positive bacteria)]
MKINKSAEQGVYVLTMLALQSGHTPVKSQVLSDIMGVSDSSLKKVLAKLSAAGLVTGSASKTGGYTLTRPIAQITLYDVFAALGVHDNAIELSGLEQRIYPDAQHTRESAQKVRATLESALHAFDEQLKTLSLGELVIEQAHSVGVVDWAARASQSQE